MTRYSARAALVVQHSVTDVYIREKTRRLSLQYLWIVGWGDERADWPSAWDFGLPSAPPMHGTFVAPASLASLISESFYVEAFAFKVA